MARGWRCPAATLIPILVLLSSCGSGAGAPVAPGPLRLLVVLPSTSLPPDEARDLIVFVDDALAAGDAIGDAAVVELAASTGTPFHQGRDDRLVCAGRIVSPHELVAFVPPAGILDPEGCAAAVEVTLPSGRAGASPDPWVFFDGPPRRVLGFEPVTELVGGAPRPFALLGTGFGPVDAQLDVAFVLEGDGRFCDGSRVASATARVVSTTRAEGWLPPSAVGVPAAARLQVSQGGVGMPADEVLVTFLPRPGEGALTEAGAIDERDATGVLAGDVDGDGVPDLVLPSGSGADVHVLRGQGGGGYAWSSSLGTGGSAVHAALGDVDGDGDLDLVVVAEDRVATAVWRGDGHGGFSDSWFALPEDDYRHVALDDVDGDGNLDVVCARRTQGATVLLGSGAGGFAGTGISLGTGGAFVVLGDLDADGLADAAVATGNRFSVYRAVGGGSFAYTGQSLGTGTLRDGRFGDVDDDGALDFVGVFETGGVRIFLGDGTGRLTYTGTPVGLTGGAQVRYTALALGDLDGDCRLDLVLAGVPGAEPDSADGRTSVWWGDGAGRFLDSGRRLGAPEGGGLGLALIDDDADGDPDLLQIVAPAARVHRYRNEE